MKTIAVIITNRYCKTIHKMSSLANKIKTDKLKIK